MANHAWMAAVLVDLIEYARKNGLVTMEQDLMVAISGSGLQETSGNAENIIELQEARRSRSEKLLAFQEPN